MHYEVTNENEDGKKYVHADGVFQPADMALCGQDLMGDSYLGWEQAKPTTAKITCENCIRIIEYCKKIKKSQYEGNI
jgi:hypothetical protein